MLPEIQGTQFSYDMDGGGAEVPPGVASAEPVRLPRMGGSIMGILVRPGYRTRGIRTSSGPG